MPLEAIAINDFDTQLMREPKKEHELKLRLYDLYNEALNLGLQAETVMQILQQGFDNGHKLYVGMFNDKPICAIGCFTSTDATIDMNVELNYLAMHRENQNRGIESMFIKQVCASEKSAGMMRITSNNAQIKAILNDLNQKLAIF